jgi:hypothetical protein
MASNVNITSSGIQKVLRNFNEKQAIAEYIWNGFDAKANTINIVYTSNALGYIDALTIEDNGYGIDFETLNVKFNPFYESEKALQQAVNKNRSAMHGKNGVGRLTFFRFANDAEWKTTYLHEGTLTSGMINIGVDSLNNYQSQVLPNPLSNATGTSILFSNLKISAEFIEQEVVPYLKSEFCWFLELNKTRGFTIQVNGQSLEYEDNIQDQEGDVLIRYEESNTLFKLKFVQWKESLHKELSKVYFLNEKSEEIYKEYTTLNKKADEYFHSVYIESEFFNDFDFSGLELDSQTNLYHRSRSAAEYKFLNKKVNDLLLAKRKLFLKEYSGKLIERYEKEGILSFNSQVNLDPNRKNGLIEFLKSLYEIQPKLFSNLSIDQKKTIVSLIDLLLISNQRQYLPDLLEGIVDLAENEKLELSNMLLDSAT